MTPSEPTLRGILAPPRGQSASLTSAVGIVLRLPADKHVLHPHIGLDDSAIDLAHSVGDVL